jgi:hypothetical protein
MRAVVIAATSAIIALGCAPGPRSNDNRNDAGGTTNPDGKLASDSGPTSTSDAPLDDGNCPDNSKLVYVLGTDNELSTFDPSTNTFTKKADIACDSDEPFSMAVDRNAIAWVEYKSGKVYQVNTTTGACVAAASLNKPDGLPNFGMAFSTDTVGGSTDTLYLGGTNDKLVSVNPATLAPTMVGGLSGSPELTGTGNAELWGFFPDDSNPHVDQIDKTTGATIKSFPGGDHLAGMPNDYAFAFWGGNFYIFLYRDPNNETVRGVRPADSEFYTVVYVMNATTGAVNPNPIDTGGLIIDGAGVSTCAPTVLQ